MRVVERQMRSGMKGWSGAAALPVLLALMGGCPEEQVVTTTRNLDRPGPLALVCAARSGLNGIVTGPGSCTGAAADAGASSGDPAGTLYGFVANTSRGEVAVFATATRGAEPLIDLDKRSPGYGFIPVGNFPVDLESSADGCRVVSANAGSCDLSMIYVPRVLQAAWPAADQPPSPGGSAVARIIPRTAAGPLRAQPQDIVLLPGSSQPGETCPTPGSYRAYVTFPRCNLIAELDLATGMVLRGLQVQADGFLETTEPVCPVDCILPGEPRRLDAGRVPDRGGDGSRDALGAADLPAPDGPRDAGVPDASPAGDRSSVDLPALADTGAGEASGGDRGGEQLVEAGPGVSSTLGVLPSGLALAEDGSRLYVSSAGAGFVSVVDINPSTGAFEKPRRILLAGRPATTRIRLSPPALQVGRFLYVVAADRSVRVISAELERECETQLDLQQVPGAEAGVPLQAARCYPVGAPETPPRRITADRLGLTFGARIPQDIAFVESHASLPDGGIPEVGPPATPLRGIFAVVITSDGTSYVVDVEDWNFVQENSSTVSRRHLPHRFRNALWGQPQSIPDAGVASVSGGGNGGVPVVVSKVLPAGASDSPSLPGLPGEGVFLGASGEPVAGQWNLVYEDQLVGRWAGDLKIAADRLSLVDPGLNFCQAGVQGALETGGRQLRHGDILVLVGCRDDSECGLEQSCVKPVAEETEFGLCLDRSRTDELFRTCTDYLRGAREYLVKQAFQDTLVLDALPIEPQAILRQPTPPPQDCRSNADCDPCFLCALEDQVVEGQPARSLRRGECFRPGCVKDADCNQAANHRCVQPLDGSPPVCSSVPLPLEVRGTCSGATQAVRDQACRPGRAAGSPCTDDRSCLDPNLECRQLSTEATEKICVDRGLVCADFPGLKGRCVRKSPCFIELQRYEVLAGRSFRVGGYRRGVADPATRECGPDPERSPLFEDRIPVGLPIYPVIVGAGCQDPVAALQLPQPNPCFERVESGYVGYTERTTSGSITFSDLSPTTVVRYANPDLWLSLGVSHLTALPVSAARTDAGVAVALAAPMPVRGLTIQLNVQSGFSRLQPPTADNLALPTNLVSSPDGFIYIVDSGDRTGSTGTRGQVIRISKDSLVPDGFMVK